MPLLYPMAPTAPGLGEPMGLPAAPLPDFGPMGLGGVEGLSDPTAAPALSWDDPESPHSALSPLPWDPLAGDTDVPSGLPSDGGQPGGGGQARGVLVAFPALTRGPGRPAAAGQEQAPARCHVPCRSGGNSCAGPRPAVTPPGCHQAGGAPAWGGGSFQGWFHPSMPRGHDDGHQP